MIDPKKAVEKWFEEISEERAGDEIIWQELVPEMMEVYMNAWESNKQEKQG